MIPINIFRWSKHNHNYSNRTRRNSSASICESDDYKHSMIQCHELARDLFQFYFEKECKHMCKTAKYLFSNQNESYMYELIRPFQDQLRTDTHFISKLDCFEEFSGGFDIRHCPGHRGILVFDKIDFKARADLRVAVSRSHYYETSYKKVTLTLNTDNPLEDLKDWLDKNPLQ